MIDPNQWAGAHINEKGTITGGRTGDQTGKEIGRCAPYHYGSYPNDWDYVIVPPEGDGGSGDGGSGGTRPVFNKPSLFVDQYYEHGMLMKLSAEVGGADHEDLALRLPIILKYPGLPPKISGVFSLNRYEEIN